MTERVENRTVQYVEGKGWLRTVPVHEVYSSDTRDGLIHIHKANCRDLNRYPTPYSGSWENTVYSEASSLKSVVEDVFRYGGSFYDEAGIPEDQHEDAWRQYVGEFRVFPCVRLPDEPTYEPGEPR